ncbi:MAG: two-component sensor histidine kinase [Burkholderiaceae bacterium]|nr:two-component sensor histidine kinase [Burkholderiaceae bacterium]
MSTEDSLLTADALAAGHNPALELAQLRAQLAQRDQQLAEMAAAHEDFLRGVSHDLRAPLRHITSYGPLVTELLQEAGTAALSAESMQEALEFLSTMEQSARRMGRMLDGLLALSRIGRAVLQPQTVALQALVAQVQAALTAGAPERAVQWNIDPHLPSVQGDAALLQQMLTELMGNALKFTRGRDPAHISLSAEHGASGVVTLRVQDNGAGFNPAQAAGLFGVFQRLHRESEFDGVGAGLAAVRAIAKRHGGDASATATVGQGCTISVTLAGTGPATAAYNPPVRLTEGSE